MTGSSHNTLDRLISQVQQLQTAEAMLLKGTTVAELADAMKCSTKQARRIIGVLKSLGCNVTDDFELGSREAATFKMTAASRLFAKKSGR